MKDFFRDNGFWLLLIALLLSILLGLGSVILSGSTDPLSNLANTLTSPFKSGVSAMLDWAEGVYGYVFQFSEMEQELSDLRRRVADLEEQARQGQEALAENAQLRELLNLQERRKDLEFESAKITARSTSNWESTLTISKGSAAGVEAGDCVITETGVLVGVVSETSLLSSTVATLIDTSIEVGGVVTRTYSAGILEGDFDLMNQGLLRLSYLPEGAGLVAGDEVLTSGLGGIYPAGLVVGRVQGVFNDAAGMSRYAIVDPSVELGGLIEVFVIKDFDVVE
ncbi:MAG: rod shape-determining protein MreC [Oscillospiraceae bacterium]|mgnify:CR=1 FL=1|nr:rod shape-determining protein MreC [Oscillospiraceae bacterium]MCI9394389.1 rod shape-determining protein MreC [Oscillospiraceae bacterium]